MDDTCQSSDHVTSRFSDTIVPIVTAGQDLTTQRARHMTRKHTDHTNTYTDGGDWRTVMKQKQTQQTAHTSSLNT